MNDFDYDCLQKKRIAQSAKHKVGKKSGCTLPSDYMTDSQIKELNGEVIITGADLHRPISYRYFKMLSVEQQEKYLKFINDTFDAPMTQIAKMMGVNVKTLTSFVNARKIDIPKHKKGMPTAMPKAFNAFCEGKDYIDILEPKEFDAPMVLRDLDGSISGREATSYSYELNFVKPSSWDQLFEALKQMPLPINGKIVVSAQSFSD